MKIFTYSQAKENLGELLKVAKKEEVLIRQNDGATFSIVQKEKSKSPFDIPGIKTNVSTKDILESIKESRMC